MIEQIQIDVGRLLQDYFCKRLINQRGVSPRTITGYRDTFRLLLSFGEKELHKKAVRFTLDDLNVELIISFLEHLEKERGNCVRSRNTRLAAIRSFLHYAGLQEPSTLPSIKRVLAIPMKRFEHPVINFLHLDETEAILDAPDSNTWSGRRDKALLVTLYNTGARVSEIVKVKCMDVEKTAGATILIHGKGRKERVLPLWKRTIHILNHWFSQIDLSPERPLFPNRFRNEMTRSGVEKRVKLAVSKACKQCPSLLEKKVSPHTIRHTTAMHLLQSGVDLSVIALWLGHECITTTHKYMHADLEMKKQALSKMKTPNVGFKKYKPSKDILAFLDLL